MSGMKTTLTYYYEEIRILYYYYVRRQRTAVKNNFVYNLTLIGTEEEAKLWPTNKRLQRQYKQGHPITIFNQKSNIRLYFIFRFILYSAFSDFSNLISTIGKQTTDDNIRLNLVFTSIFAIVITLEYLIGWKLYENQIEEEIFKTKKMLSIIPIEALMKVNNIEKLLHLKGVVNSIKGNDIKNAK